MKYLKEKFIPGQDEIVEEWALTAQKSEDDYFKKDYSYNKEKYSGGYTQQVVPQQN